MAPATGPTDPALTGASGVFFVASELCFRGLIAVPTMRNTAGFDVVATNPTTGWHANIQVKTSKSPVKFWPVGKGHARLPGPNNFYVFLRRVVGREGFEAFLEAADRVSARVEESLRIGRERGCKEFTPCFYPEDTAESWKRLHQQWLDFGR